MINNVKTTNVLLMLIVLPLFFYVLKVLSFIFVPLTLSMFIALFFLPFTRWLKKYGVPNVVCIILVILVIAGMLKGLGELIQLSSKELLQADTQMLVKVQERLTLAIIAIEDFFGIQHVQNENVLMYYFQKFNFMDRFDSTLDFISNTISMVLMTTFFVILLLSESINFQKVLNSTILKKRIASIKVFMRIEKDLIKFIVVKFIISLLTGVGFTIACLIFDVSFPIFWGIIAFAINYIQMIGSFISVIALSIFALVEIETTGSLMLFILFITGVQALFGAILEPVFMGKSFSINIITILVMLMFWGFIWGIPGLIMSVPITVFLKIIFEQYESTRIIAKLMAGPEKQIVPGRLKKDKA